MLLAAYNFDRVDQGVVLDRTANQHDFALVGTDADLVPGGHTLGGLTKTGAIMPTVAKPPFGETPHRTVMLWAKGDDTVWYVRWQVESINSGSWGILVLNNEVGVQARSASDLVRPSAPVPTDGLWHHYAGTYDGATVRVFIDAVEVASSALAPPLRTDADWIDLAEWNQSTTIIDDLRMYDEALSESEVSQAMSTPVTASQSGTALAELGALSASAVGTRTVRGNTLAELGGLSAVARTEAVPAAREPRLYIRPNPAVAAVSPNAALARVV